MEKPPPQLATSLAWVSRSGSAAREARSHLPERPAPNTFYGESAWQTRIGKLTPEGEDHWWTFSTTSDANQSVDPLALVLETYAPPAMAKRLSQ